MILLAQSSRDLIIFAGNKVFAAFVHSSVSPLPAQSTGKIPQLKSGHLQNQFALLALASLSRAAAKYEMITTLKKTVLLKKNKKQQQGDKKEYKYELDENEEEWQWEEQEEYNPY
ncbi:MAG: hypothetical protein EZS28_018264, partial [Streblomastix strix]